MSKLTINIDSTALSHSGCILNLYRTVIGSLDEQGQSTGGYKEHAMGASLVLGISVHKFLDIMYKTGGIYPKARKAAVEIFEALPKRIDEKKAYLGEIKYLETVCYNVWSNYVEQDSTFDIIKVLQPCYLCKGTGVVDSLTCPHCKGEKLLLAPATELTFRIKYYEDDTCIIYLCGTIDSIGKFHNGCYAIRDWKTTSSWSNNGYFQQYELSRQLRIYLLSIKLMSVYEPESTLGKLGSQQMGAFIDAIFLKAKPNETKCERSEVYQIKPADLDAFQMTLDDKCRELSQAIKTGYLPKQGILNGSCEKKFGKCAFWDCCRNNDQVSEVLLKRNFKQIQFDPLRYNEV